MGQRSQIYVRYHNGKHTALLARYYGWNFGFRMLSRARYAIGWILERQDQDWFLRSDEISKLPRILDINFDMCDCVLSSDIIAEWIDQFPNSDFKTYVFTDHDNNDGKLFIDICKDESGEHFHKVKYAFTTYAPEKDPLMDALGYAEWNVGTGWRNPNDYRTQEEIDTAMDNIEYITGHAQLMTQEELAEFMDHDYSDHIATYPAHNYAADAARQNLAHRDPAQRGARQYAAYFHQLYTNLLSPYNVQGHKMLEAIKENDLNAFVEALTGHSVHDTLKFAHLCADDECTFCIAGEEFETTMRFCSTHLGNQEAKCTVNLRTQQVYNIRNQMDVPYLAAALDRCSLKRIQIDSFDYPVVSREERERQWYPVSFWYDNGVGGATPDSDNALREE